MPIYVHELFGARHVTAAVAQQKRLSRRHPHRRSKKQCFIRQKILALNAQLLVPLSKIDERRRPQRFFVEQEFSDEDEPEFRWVARKVKGQRARNLGMEYQALAK